MNEAEKYFLVVAEELNISKAAQRLFVSHQNISQHIQNLEEKYGTQLIIRKPKMMLTPAGRDLADTLAHVKVLEDQMLLRLRENDPGGRILSVCEIPLENERMGYQKIYEITEQQMEQHPNLNLLYVTNGLTQWAAAAVKSHKKQGAIRVLGFERTEMTCSFIQEGIICATVCQGPGQQWYSAVNIMNEYLAGDRAIDNPVFNAECRILIKESLPFVKFNSISDM